MNIRERITKLRKKINWNFEINVINLIMFLIAIISLGFTHCTFINSQKTSVKLYRPMLKQFISNEMVSIEDNQVIINCTVYVYNKGVIAAKSIMNYCTFIENNDVIAKSEYEIIEKVIFPNDDDVIFNLQEKVITNDFSNLKLIIRTEYLGIDKNILFTEYTYQYDNKIKRFKIISTALDY